MKLLADLAKIFNFLRQALRRKIIVKKTAGQIRRRRFEFFKRDFEFFPNRPFRPIGNREGDALHILELVEIISPRMRRQISPTHHAVIGNAHHLAALRLVDGGARPLRALLHRLVAHIGMMPPHPKPVANRRSIK